MKPIAVALDRIHSDSCQKSDALRLWKKLEDDLKESHQQPTVMEKLLSRTKQVHANILDPNYQGMR